jgi:hypothetical protein
MLSGTDPSRGSETSAVEFEGSSALSTFCSKQGAKKFGHPHERWASCLRITPVSDGGGISSANSLNASTRRCSKKESKNMIDLAVRTQEINRWDAVSTRLHNIVGQSDLFTKTEVLVRRTRAHNTSMILSAISG